MDYKILHRNDLDLYYALFYLSIKTFPCIFARSYD